VTVCLIPFFIDCFADIQDIRESGWAPAAGASDGIAAKRLKNKTP
jgi:hypothetical protein